MRAYAPSGTRWTVRKPAIARVALRNVSRSPPCPPGTGRRCWRPCSGWMRSGGGLQFLDQDVDVPPQKVKMASSLIDLMTVDFDPSMYGERQL